MPENNYGHGRTVLGRPAAELLPFELMTTDSSQSAIALSQFADSPAVRFRRFTPEKGWSPLIELANEYLAHVMDLPDDEFLAVTSDASEKVCVSRFEAATARMTARSCTTARPYAAVRTGDAISLVELEKPKPSLPSNAKEKALAAPAKRVQSKTEKKPAKQKKKSPSRAGKPKAPSKTKAVPLPTPPSHPAQVRLRTMDWTSGIKGESSSTGLQFVPAQLNLSLIDARRVSDSELLVAFYERASAKGGARVSAARLANGTFLQGSKQTVFEAATGFGHVKDHFGIGLAGYEDNILLVNREGKARECAAYRLLPSVTKLSGPDDVCSSAPHLLLKPDLATFEKALSLPALTDRHGIAMAGDVLVYANGAELRAVNMRKRAAVPVSHPFMGSRAALDAVGVDLDGDSAALVGKDLFTISKLGEVSVIDVSAYVGGALARLQASRGFHRSPPASLFRAANRWWLSLDGLYPLEGEAPSPEGARAGRGPVVGFEEGAVAAEMFGDRVTLKPLLGHPAQKAVSYALIVREGALFVKTEATVGLLIGRSRKQPDRALAASVDLRTLKVGKAHSFALAEGKTEGVMLALILPQGNVAVLNEDHTQAVWLSPSGAHLETASVPEGESKRGFSCHRGRIANAVLPSTIPGKFMPFERPEHGRTCLSSNMLLGSDGVLRWFEENELGLDLVPLHGRLALLGIAPNREGRASSTEGAVVKPTGSAPCPADMVLVGGQLCIDRYEGVLVDDLSGAPLSASYPPEQKLFLSTQSEWSSSRRTTHDLPARALPLPWLPFDYGTREFVPRAASLRAVQPAGYVTGFVAEAACERASKRLCEREEFELACRGENDLHFPYGDVYKPGACNVDRETHPALLLHGNPSIGHMDPRLNHVVHEGKPLLRHTGTTKSCASTWGHDAVYDLVGNLDEWVEGGFAGGFYSRSSRTGCDAFISSHPKGYRDYSTGLRCCREPNR